MLMPGFTDGLKYTVVARAVAGGDLTARANAPNPAGLNLLKKYFNNTLSPASLFLTAAVPTVLWWRSGLCKARSIKKRELRKYQYLNVGLT